MTSETFTGRREDTRLVTGNGRFTADWNLPGQLYGAFLRSDRAHAQIATLDLEAARAQPGVVAILTGAETDAAGMPFPPPRMPFAGRNGEQIKAAARGVFARTHVRHVGEPIALVVAQTALAAQDAVEGIAIEYNDLPPVVDAMRALQPGAPQLYPEVPGNLCHDVEYGDSLKVEEAFARAAHITRLQLDSQRLVGNPMEPKACLATYDAAAEVYDLWSPTQGITSMRASLAAFGVGAEKVRPRAQDVGGGFGVRSPAYPEYLAVMLAARQTGKPVQWVGTRSENFVSDYHGRAITLFGELALDARGNMLALRYEWVCNIGAYPAASGPLIDILSARLAPIGVYRIPVMYGRHRLALTNTTPITAYRGAGRPDNIYLIERLVEEAARETGIDRTELRRRNLIPKDAFPYKTPTQSAYDSGDYPGQLDKALEYAGWGTFEQRRAESSARRKLRGIGLALFVESAGGGLPGGADQTMLKFGGDGRMTLYSVAGPSGQGHETVFPEVVGRALGIDPGLITLRTSDPDGPALQGLGTIGSRSMIAHGGAALIGAREVIKKGTVPAAAQLEAAPADIEFAGGRYRIAGTDRSIGLMELARKLELARKHAGAEAHPLDALGENVAAGTYPSGAHVAEVEIDPETGEIEVLRYVAVDDCGVVLNHTLLEGQIHGGIVQGAGQVLIEHCIYDQENGQLLTGSFMDYGMPRADLLGEMQLYDHSTPAPGNPLGVKGVGEAGTTGSLPALMNALLDALRPLGVTHFDMPATPLRVWAAIRAAPGKQAGK